jgi:hypothetical protein
VTRVLRRVLGVPLAVSEEPPERREHSEEQLLGEPRRLREPHHVVIFVHQHGELERVWHTVAVRPPGAAEPPESLEHAFEADDRTSCLGNDMSLLVARVPPVVNGAGRGNDLRARLRDLLAPVEQERDAPRNDFPPSSSEGW